MIDILLITPPFVQLNTPYPATAYLKGYLAAKGYAAEQYDLGIETACRVFSREFITRVFDSYEGGGDENIERIYSLRRSYITTIDSVIAFLQGRDNTVAQLICGADFIPQAGRFETIGDLDAIYGELGTIDCAKHIASYYIQDMSDFIRAVVTPHFEVVRYGEKIAVSVADFAVLQQELDKPLNIIEQAMIELLGSRISICQPRIVGFTVPFPGNLLSALRCAQYIKANHKDITTLMGGGYPTTELRQREDKAIENYFDHIILDDGIAELESIVSGTVVGERVPFKALGCPDYSGLPHQKYISLCELANPMHRLWSDGRWNKMTLAAGCYWAKCAFCDTSLDYICRFEPLSAQTIVDYMERIVAQTGSTGFHFTDEAAPPKLLKELSLEIIRRGLRFTWWTNVRFESAYTGDLCRLMASAGCIAVSGGLEAASDRLLAMVGKGVDVEQATMVLRNFFYAGIMTHTYLMYGLPTQTLQESVDSLEVVRQLFAAELINSAFWHRYAMTLHSPMGLNPENYGVKRKTERLNPFANNEIYFSENRGYNINIVGDALRTALANFQAGSLIDRAAHKWFECKAPSTTVEPTVVIDQLIKPDNSRIFNPKARIVWLGAAVELCEEGILVRTNAEDKQIKFDESVAAFFVEATALCGDLSQTVTLEMMQQIFERHSQESFVQLYHSKKFDIVRSMGLLQI